jgi:hypothetical protein
MSPLALFLAGFALHNAALVAAVCGGAGGLFLCSRRAMGVAPQPEPLRRSEWLVLMVFAGQAIFLVCWAPQVALGWDGLVLWEAKAKAAFAHGGVLPINYLNDPPFSVAQPLYPLYLPYLEDWLYLCLGRADQAWVRALGPVIYLAAILLMAGAAQRLGVSRLAGLLAAVAFFFVPYCFTGRWNVLSGYADFPLGVFYLAAASRLPGLFRGHRVPTCDYLPCLQAWFRG